MTRSLRVEEVSFSYEAGRAVLSRVSASVPGGSMVGMVGPNGAGKSTLLRVLCGILRPQTGRILLDSSPLAQFTARERARVLAYLPQAITPAFSLTAFEVVCLGRYPHVSQFGALGERDRAFALECMRATETSELRGREFLTLSGGERQRVLIASVLAQEPALLLLDEPTSALDLHHQLEVFALMRRLAGDGYGLGVVTHDLNLAARFCDRLLLLSLRGAVLAEGPPDAVLTEPLLSEAYGARIRVCAHPLTGSILVSAELPETRP